MSATTNQGGRTHLMNMNIAMDVSSTAGFRTGTEEYIEGLVYGLFKLGIAVVGVGRQNQGLQPDEPCLGLDVRSSPSPIAKWWWEYYGVRRVPRDVNVLHIPFMAHPEGRLSVPSVVTVHDLIPYRLDAYRKSVKEQRYFSHIGRAMPYADCLVAISQATYNDLSELFPSLVNKTVVIPNGVHHHYFEEMPIEQVGFVARRFGLRRRPRMLYAGGYDERKNVGTLIRAMKGVFARHPGGELVLVGAKDNLTIRRQVQDQGIEGRVVVTPFVSRADLVALYNGADVFVYPSRFEGFGLPPAQALAVGIPVVASDIPPIQEVVREYGTLVNPNSVEAWVSAIDEVLNGSDSLQRRVTEGQAYAQAFSWPHIAEAYLKIYEDVVKGRRS